MPGYVFPQNPINGQTWVDPYSMIWIYLVSSKQWVKVTRENKVPTITRPVPSTTLPRQSTGADIAYTLLPPNRVVGADVSSNPTPGRPYRYSGK